MFEDSALCSKTLDDRMFFFCNSQESEETLCVFLTFVDLDFFCKAPPTTNIFATLIWILAPNSTVCLDSTLEALFALTITSAV